MVLDPVRQLSSPGHALNVVSQPSRHHPHSHRQSHRQARVQSERHKNGSAIANGRTTSAVAGEDSGKSIAAWSKIRLKKNGAEVFPERVVERLPNIIRTTRFTVASWLPKSLYYQFHRAANIYFVCIAAISCIPFVEAKWQPKVLTVILILFAQALKDLYEDLKRWKDDRVVNRRPVARFEPASGDFKEAMWSEVHVGDLLLVEKGSSFPADLLVLGCSDTSGVFYVATKSMDGETNLKERFAPALVHEQLGAEEEEEKVSHVGSNVTEDGGETRRRRFAARLLELRLEVNLEKPHPSVVDLDCSLRVRGSGESAGLSSLNFGLRGHELQNTSWVLGVACYVGDETKVRLNSFPPPSKSSELERFLNNCVLCILVFLVVVSSYFAIASRISYSEVQPLYEVFMKYLVILYPVLPMTLYIAFEVLHLVIGIQIELDPLMYHKESDAYAKARNTSVVEELGQVDFVFSDKTGTLTANEMRFAYCSVGKATYGPFLPSDDGRPGAGTGQVARLMRGTDRCAEEVRQFFSLLAVCHTVKLDEDGTFQGESPDEVALVDAARSNGFELIGRETTAGGSVIHKVRTSFVVDANAGDTQDHEIKHFLAFNSDRKRMSVICAEPDGGAVVLTKGADSVMEKLLLEPLPREARLALHEFSRQGLRTLLVARKRMSPAEYAEWKGRWDEAGREMEDRATKLDAVAELAETGMGYVGVTALEDRLQDNVPSTIATLREAGIRVWVLTGDKVETAVEIAKSCRLIDDDMNLVEVVDASSPSDCVEKLLGASAYASEGAVKSQGSKLKGVSADLGMVLDGRSIGHILSDGSAKAALYRAAVSSSACVCCRLSPMQKRELVELVRAQNPKAITLAIGDGANDVPMIQGAHVGIGVRGKEGSSAVQASDMAISQFCFLGNLVLCHGRKAYRRVSTFLLYFIYKSLALGWSYIVYAHTTAFSGEGAYPQWLDVIWNPLTSCAVVLILASDVDVPDEVALETPSLYEPGPKRRLFNARTFGRWMLLATVQGVMAWCVPVYGLTSYAERNDRPLEEGGPFWQASFTAFTTIFLIVHLQLFLVAERPLHKWGALALLSELVAYVPVAIGLGSSLAPSHELLNAPQSLVTSWSHLAVLVLVPLAALAPEAVCMAWWKYRRGVSDEGFDPVDNIGDPDTTSDSDSETSETEPI